MLIKILGLIDIISGLIHLTISSGINVYPQILFFFGVLTFSKSFINFFDVGGIIDLIGGLILLISLIFPLHGVFSFLIGVLLLQKGFFSFI